MLNWTVSFVRFDIKNIGKRWNSQSNKLLTTTTTTAIRLRVRERERGRRSKDWAWERGVPHVRYATVVIYASCVEYSYYCCFVFSVVRANTIIHYAVTQRILELKTHRKNLCILLNYASFSLLFDLMCGWRRGDWSQLSFVFKHKLLSSPLSSLLSSFTPSYYFLSLSSVSLLAILCFFSFYQSTYPSFWVSLSLKPYISLTLTSTCTFGAFVSSAFFFYYRLTEL